MWLDDKHWLRASRFIASLPTNVRYVLSPAEMNHLRGDCLPIAFSHIVEPDECVLVMPKDDVDFLPLSWIAKRHHWDVIYADEVFAAFRFSESVTDGVLQSEHLPYLYDRAAKVEAQQPVRSLRIDAALSDHINNQPYAVIASASMVGNAGDRLIAAAAVRLLKKAWPHLAIVVADGNPDRDLVAKASAIIIGPGGMFYDLERNRIDLMNLANWFRYGHLAQEYGVPLFSVGLGYQGVVSSLGWRFVIESLNSARLVITRDIETTNLLSEQLSCPIETRADLSVLFSEEIEEFSNEEKTQIITLCGDFRHIKYVAQSLSEVLQKFDGFRLRFVIQANEDQGTLDVHGDALRTLSTHDMDIMDCREADPIEFCRAIATSDMVITTRFHGMMVALMAGVNTLVLTNPGDKRERVQQEVGELPWVKFKRRVTDFRELLPIINAMMAELSHGVDREIRFKNDQFDHVIENLSAALAQ